MLNFDFLEKGLRVVSPSHFVYDFSKKKCLSCYALLTDQISLPDCLYFLRYWLICVCTFEISLIFLIKPLFNITENSRQKFKYFENKRSF